MNKPSERTDIILSDVITTFIDQKSNFDLDYSEKADLYDTLFRLLEKLHDNYQFDCFDINQIMLHEVVYYTFTFESLVTVDRERENILGAAAIHFMAEFTDNDGKFISFTKMGNNRGIYQLNFCIS